MCQPKDLGGNHANMSVKPQQLSVVEWLAVYFFHYIFHFLLRTASKSATISPQMQIFIRLVITASPILPDNSKRAIRKIPQTTVTQLGMFIYV